MPLEFQQTGISSHFRYRQETHKADFRVNCDAGEGGSLRATTDSLSIIAGQQIRRGQAIETWNSVHIYSKHEPDGSLSLRIVIFHPDWEEPVQIAHLRSRPQSTAEEASGLECDLNHKHF